MTRTPRRTKPAILALLNNALEDFIVKGQASWYPDYVNVGSLFGDVHVLYRYTRGGKARAFGMQLIRVRDLPIVSPLVLLFKTVVATRKCRPDVIRAYNTQVEGLVATLTQMITGVPAAVSIHSEYDELVMVRGYPALVRLAVRFVEKFVVRRARGVWCVTPYIAQRAVRLGASPNRVRVIYNKVRISQFRKAPRLRGRMRRRLGVLDEFVVLHVGRFEVGKNLLTIIRAVSLLVREKRRIRLVLCGDDPPRSLDPPLRPVLEEECKRLNVEGAVIFAGFVPNEKLPEYYGAADAFVFAPKVVGFGVVLVKLRRRLYRSLHQTYSSQEIVS